MNAVAAQIIVSGRIGQKKGALRILIPTVVGFCEMEPPLADTRLDTITSRFLYPITSQKQGVKRPYSRRCTSRANLWYRTPSASARGISGEDALERAIQLRKECPEFGWGDYEILDVSTPEVLVHICRWKRGVALAAHNLSGKDCTVELAIAEEDTADLLKVFGDQVYEAFEAASGKLHLSGYGYRWFRKSFLHSATSVEEEG